jgi:hypothetical protein
MADISITAASVLASSSAVIDRLHNFGATVTTGQSVYLDPTALTWKLIDSNAAATGNELTTVKGVALHGGANGQPAAVVLEDPDFTPGGTLTNGSAVFTSTTAGGITHDVPSSGAYPTFLGLAKSTTKLNLRPCSSGAVI